MKHEPDEVQRDVESKCTPETYTCNGSGSKKTCKHQSKRKQLEREKELLRRKEETPNQEEEEPGMEGEVTQMQEEHIQPAVTETGFWVGKTLRTSGGQAGKHITHGRRG